MSLRDGVGEGGGRSDAGGACGGRCVPVRTADGAQHERGVERRHHSLPSLVLAATGQSAPVPSRLFFGGKSLIHPTQVEPARRGFLVSEGEITWAKKVLAGAETGAVRIDGQMVDAPVIARARGILERAKTPSEAG